MVTISGFVDHAVSVTTTQLCHCSVKADVNNMYQMGVAVFQ